MCWTAANGSAANGRGEQRRTEGAQCKLSELLSQRLVDGHVFINNIYFAAALDHRLRYFFIDGCHAAGSCLPLHDCTRLVPYKWCKIDSV